MKPIHRLIVPSRTYRTTSRTGRPTTPTSLATRTTSRCGVSRRRGWRPRWYVKRAADLREPRWPDRWPEIPQPRGLTTPRRSVILITMVKDECRSWISSMPPIPATATSEPAAYAPAGPGHGQQRTLIEAGPVAGWTAGGHTDGRSRVCGCGVPPGAGSRAPRRPSGKRASSFWSDRPMSSPEPSRLNWPSIPKRCRYHLRPIMARARESWSRPCSVTPIS
ncbi:MAG: hypothetical protein CM1200mP2_12440 [Planctomycetaceae bacterium]|nr:MAG: hypothetical protein CM1200mP2_12440 [Planctomycetaceae bacterium]